MSPQKVLVVEDSPAMRGLIASVIDEMDGCEVTEVANGYEALRQLPRNGYALVVTDINMPDINGLELLQFIRKNPQFGNTPVIIVSTEGSSSDRERGMALGANRYLNKPFRPDELKKAVCDLLEEAASGTP